MSETPYYLESIGNNVFSGCSSLENIAIPTSVTSIGDGAFQDCDSLTHVYYEGSESQWNYINIGSDNDNLINAIKYCNQQPASLQDIYDYHDDNKADKNRILNYIDYDISNNQVTITGLKSGVQVTDLIGDFIIPDTIEGCNITSISNLCFAGCSNITSVILPNTIASIGNAAFQDCTRLTNINIPDSIIAINSNTFKNCTMLTNITIPDGVESIGSNAFNGCNKLKNIIIPKTVTSIGNSAFLGCTALTDVYYGDTETEWNNIQGGGKPTSTIHYNQETAKIQDIYDYHDDVKSDKPRILDYITYTKSNNQVTITGLKSGVQSTDLIGDFIIPDTIEGCNVVAIGDRVFQNCTGLTSVSISDSVVSIGTYAFYGCTGLTSITIGDGVMTIGSVAFGGCRSLTNLVIPDNVVLINSNAFQACNELTSVVIGDSVTSIRSEAFAGCTNLVDLIIGENVTSIGSYAFQSCPGLTSIVIPKGVTSIGYHAFDGCTGLKSITIPDSVTEIGSNLFQGCTGLTDIYYGGTEAQWSTLSVSVPAGVTVHLNFSHCYQHNINLQGAAYNTTTPLAFGTAVLVTNSATPFTVATLAAYLYDNGFLEATNRFNASGFADSSGRYWLCGMMSDDGQTIKLFARNATADSTLSFASMRYFSDTVIQIM